LKGRSGSLFGLAFQAAKDNALDQGIEFLDVAGRAGGHRPCLTQLDQLKERARFKGALAREDFVEHKAQRVDVALDRDIFAVQLFGGHVGGRARAHLVLAKLFFQPRQSEIQDAHVALPVDHHVGGFQVAVEHAVIVRGGQARAELARDLKRLVGGQAADASEQRRQLFSLDELHGEELLAVNFANVVNAADVAMRDLPRHSHFPVKASQRRAVARERFRQKLERDRLAQLEIIGAVDFAHSAATNQSDDAIALDQYRPRNEPRIIDRAE
jgi:hypothetical protein